MKKLAALAVVALAALVGFNYATTGEIRLVPDLERSDEERTLDDLDDRLARLRKQFAQAHRSAAVAGIDTTADVEAARTAARRIEKELKALRGKITGKSAEKVRRKADRLAAALEEFAADLR